MIGASPYMRFIVLRVKLSLQNCPSIFVKIGETTKRPRLNLKLNVTLMIEFMEHILANFNLAQNPRKAFDC